MFSRLDVAMTVISCFVGMHIIYVWLAIPNVVGYPFDQPIHIRYPR